jgi:sugar phosphate permease
VLHEDPTGRSLWWAVRYVLRVRTNLIIIIASALGYFFFTGLRSFSTLYVTGHYGLHKPVADALLLVIGVGALAGVFAGGRVSDRLLHQGNVRGRIIVPTVCLFALVPVMAPAIATDSVALALPLFVLGAFLLGAPNPPLDAARLDIIHPRLWGRAEGVRTVLRTLGEAGAPLLFGYISQYVFGGPGASAGNSGSGAVHTGDARGLEYTFLIFLVPLLAAAILALAALRTYPRDVATATASREAISRAEQRQAARSRPPERRR